MRTSGTSKLKLPELLKYPELLPFDSAPIKDIFCYVIRHYGNAGLSALIYRQPQKDQVVIICGDWLGNKIDIVSDKPTTLVTHANELVKDRIMVLYETMRLIKLDQAQFFFAIVDGELILVDIQVGINKFASPGMLRDVFSKVFPTQEVQKIEILDDRAMEYIEYGSGSYSGDLILKPSRFRMHSVTPDNFVPLYVEVKR